MGRRALYLNLAFWTVIGVFTASTWMLSPIGDLYPYPWRLLASALFNAYLWALLTPLIFAYVARSNAGGRFDRRRIMALLGLGLLISALVTGLASAVHAWLLPAPAIFPRIEPTFRSAVAHLSRWYAQQVGAFFGIFIASLAVDITRRFHAREREAAKLREEASRMQAEQAAMERQQAELQAQLAEARLTVLRTRLNPHFLFNTLNAVSALITEDPAGGRDMIALLSELLRHALSERTEQEIPLREEIRLLRLYLEIVEIRYQGQLSSDVAFDADTHDALVPNLILQPLVENAMKHAIDRAGGHGSISVRGVRSGEDLVLEVRDSGPGRGGATPAAGSSGVGLRLTTARLSELYGEQQRFELIPDASGGMCARIVLPYHTSADLRIAEAAVAES